MVRTLLFVLLAGCSGCGLDQVGSAESVSALNTPPPIGTLTGTPWERHVVYSGPRGADGVDVRGAGESLQIATAWEEAGIVTVSSHPGYANLGSAWPTTTYTGFVGPEDAKFADLDHDGVPDLVVATDAGQRVWVVIDGVKTVLPESAGHGRWMQAASTDVDHDGYDDVVAASRVGTPAVVAWFHNPAVTGGGWTYHKISTAGWGMTVAPQADGSLLVTDRAAYKDAGGVIRWDLYGARILRPGPDVTAEWVNEPISVAGSCPTCTPGDEMFGGLLADGSLLHCQSKAGTPNRVVRQHRTPGVGNGWSAPALLPAPAYSAAGGCQGPVEGDLDHDEMPDVVVSTWEADALPASTKVGVYAILGTGELRDISGPTGTKHDNALLIDVDGDGWVDVLDSEQVENLGVIWYRNPGVF